MRSGRYNRVGEYTPSFPNLGMVSQPGNMDVKRDLLRDVGLHILSDRAGQKNFEIMSKSENLGEKQKGFEPSGEGNTATYRDSDGILRFVDDDKPLAEEANLIPMKVFDKETGEEVIRLVDSRKPWMKRLDQADDSMPRPDLRKFSEAVWRHSGNLTEVAAFFGVSRHLVVNRWMKARPYKQVVEEIREAILDYAEDALDEMVMNGNIIATIFKLKTLGKSRGYVEESSKDTNLNQTIKVKVSKR